MVDGIAHQTKDRHSKDVEEPFITHRQSIESQSSMRSSPRLAPFLRCALLLFILALVAILFISQTVPEFNQYRLVKSYGQSQADLERKTRTILLWNSFYGDTRWSLPDDTVVPDVLRDNLQCPVYNCEITNKRERLADVEHYDAVIFHTAQAFSLMNSIPDRRHPDQVYVFAQMEPPGETKHILSDEGDFYNWTMTYRLDSDILWPYQYIEDIALGTIVAPNKLPAWRQPPATFNDTKLWSVVLKKTHMAAWFVSHCNTLSKRDELAAALQNYIDVDIYGKCGNMVCQRFTKECDDILDFKYRFYLSFENSLCNDYVTEKLYNALSRSIIPVVYGGANYSRFMPPHSYINAESFASVEELADYLKYLSTHPEEYMRYFWWRQHYKLRYVSPFCDLCEKLHEPSFVYKKQSYTSIQDWWLNGSCRFEASEVIEEKEPKNVRSILLWNDFFGDKRWNLPDDKIGPTVFRDVLQCPVHNCELSNTQAYLHAPELYDAVLFHTAQPFPLTNYKPDRRRKEQVYIFAQLEPPGETKHVLTDESDFYNWTMTYRLDSDIIWPQQYMEDIETGIVVAPALRPMWRRPPAIWNDTELWTMVKNKTRKAALFQITCDTLSKSDKLAGVLQKYLEVDIYGNLTCQNHSKECDEVLDQKYLFYLSFETSLCTDYVTRKLYNVLDRQIVPVVYGGADYTRFLPPHSYINAELFQNVQELADHLNYLATHPAEYMRYFWWRQYYKLRKYSPFCSLCEKLNGAAFENTRKTYTNIQDWWLNDTCFEPSLDFVLNEEPTIQVSQLLVTDKRNMPCQKGEIRDHRNKCRKHIKFTRSRRPQMVRHRRP